MIPSPVRYLPILAVLVLASCGGGNADSAADPSTPDPGGGFDHAGRGEAPLPTTPETAPPLVERVPLRIPAALPPMPDPGPDRWGRRHDVLLRPDSIYRLLMLTTFHGEDIDTAWAGLAWTGLYADEETSRLRRVRLRFVRVHDPIVDAGGEKTGIQIRLAGEAEDRDTLPVLLIGGERPLPDGPVPGRLLSGSMTFGPGDSALVPPDRLFFALTDSVHDYGRYLAWMGYSLGLTDGRTTQVLAHYVELADEGEGFPYPIWGGDLDGDGQGDLLLETTDHYNVSHPVLFLSGEAEEGRLVRPVAELRAVGC